MVEDTKRKKIVGLKYNQGEGLPKLILKGAGPQVDKIIEARDALYGPIIVKDEKLLQQLYQLPIDAEIGKELFDLVAVLLVHVFAVEGKRKGAKK